MQPRSRQDRGDFVVEIKISFYFVSIPDGSLVFHAEVWILLLLLYLIACLVLISPGIEAYVVQPKQRHHSVLSQVVSDDVYTFVEVTKAIGPLVTMLLYVRWFKNLLAESDKRFTDNLADSDKRFSDLLSLHSTIRATDEVALNAIVEKLSRDLKSSREQLSRDLKSSNDLTNEKINNLTR